MKNLIKKLVLNEDKIELAQNYMNDNKISPLILELKTLSPELAEIVHLATDDSGSRKSAEFRQQIKSDLLPLLPNLSRLDNAEDFFLHRSLNNTDHTFFSSLTENEEFEMPNHFQAFYLNGISAGGLTDGCNISLICESIDHAKLLGNLSQVPTENEVLIAGGERYKVCGVFESANDLLNSGLISKVRTIEFLEMYRRNFWNNGCSYILIKALV